MYFAEDPFESGRASRQDPSCSHILPFNQNEKIWLIAEIIIDIFWLTLIYYLVNYVDTTCNSPFYLYGKVLFWLFIVTLALRTFLLIVIQYCMFEIRVQSSIFIFAIMGIILLIILMVAECFWGLVVASLYEETDGCGALYYTEIIFLVFVCVQIGLRACGPMCGFCCVWCNYIWSETRPPSQRRN